MLSQQSETDTPPVPEVVAESVGTRKQFGAKNAQIPGIQESGVARRALVPTGLDQYARRATLTCILDPLFETSVHQ